MSISIGDRLPDASFFVATDDGLSKLTNADLFEGKTVVLFAVVGAFTGTCSQNHLPGYLDHLDDIKAKGVDEVAVLAVNDPFVMDAWARSSGGKGKIHFLSDGNATFTNAIGMELEGSGAGLGTRSQRYSMIVKDGVVTALNQEENPGVSTVSGAAAVLEML